MKIEKAIKIALENNKCIVIKNGVETKRIKPTVELIQFLHSQGIQNN